MSTSVSASKSKMPAKKSVAAASETPVVAAAPAPAKASKAAKASTPAKAEVTVPVVTSTSTEVVAPVETRHASEILADLHEQIKALGVSVAVDDFGTGYSSLSYLKRLPIDVIKIDRSFITDAGGDLESAQFVRTIVTLGHALGLSLVAEGIETEAQLDLLRDCGCEMGQGYLFGRPMPAEDFRLWLSRSQSVP